MATAERTETKGNQEPFIAEFNNTVRVPSACKFNGINIHPNVEIEDLEKFLYKDPDEVKNLDSLNSRIVGIGIALKKLIIAASLTQEGASPLGIKIKKTKPQTLHQSINTVINLENFREQFLSVNSSDIKGVTLSLYRKRSDGKYDIDRFIQVPAGRTIEPGTKSQLTYFAIDEKSLNGFEDKGLYSPAAFPDEIAVNSGYARVLQTTIREFIECFEVVEHP